MSMHSTLNAKHGPLKTWQWAGLLGTAVVLGLVLRARSQSKAASAQTVDPATSDDPIDPWTGIPYSQEGLGAGGAPGIGGGGGDTTVPDTPDTTVPVTMDPPDWYTDPPPWWQTAPGVPASPDPKPDVAPQGTNQPKATHKAVSPPKATKASIAAAPAGAKSGTAQPTTGGGAHAALADLSGPIHTNDGGEHYETITKDHKVYHYYPGRHGSTAYVYIRPASH